MLNVSTAWNNMFSKNLIAEGLIKFVIEDYGTLYKKDIFSYKFVGRNRFLCDEYPQYNATMVAVYRDDYLNFNNFIGKKVEIYYGFIINGSDEYVKALTLFIDSIDISDDGRKATFVLKSKFAYLTDTFSVILYRSYKGGSYDWLEDYDDFIYDQLGSGNYTKAGGLNKNVRGLPSKITNGNAVQELTFVNCAYIKLDADGKFYINDTILSSNKVSNYPINILKYPHYSKMEQPTIVVVDWLDLDDLELQIGSLGYDYASVLYNHITQTYQGSTTRNIDNSGLFLSWECLNIRTSLTIANTSSITTYNDKYSISVKASSQGSVYFDSVGGYQYTNYYGVEDGKVSIFDININDQTHANAIQTRVANYLSSQKYVELELRINPAYELLDELYFENNNKCVLIEELTISFDKSFSGKIVGRFEATFKSPDVAIVQIDQNGDYEIMISNNNYFPTKLTISHSGGDIEIDMDKNEIINITQDDYPELMSSFSEYYNQQLQDEVICYFDTIDGTATSDNTIILDANL